MVDFADSKIGGGILRNGCVQEEIMFCMFPEMIILKVICEKLDDEDAVIVYGARKYSKTIGYSDSFRFNGPNNFKKNA
jgi:poly(ADP-ribose) glycohydrolase